MIIDAMEVATNLVHLDRQPWKDLLKHAHQKDPSRAFQEYDVLINYLMFNQQEPPLVLFI